MIEVRIPVSRLVAFGSEVHASIYILKRLRGEGIPMVGVLGPVGPERGVLTVEFDDLAMDEWVYTWREA